MWRVLDTGLRSAAQNIALDRALLEARHAEEIPSTLRFCRFTPSVLLASRQSPAQECDLDYCAAHDIAVQRRISGGETVYCDGAQLGWALYLHSREAAAGDMRAIARRICHAAAAAIGALGADARFRAREHIEIDGRQIGSGGGTFDGNAVLYQGTLHFERDLKTMARATRTPAGGQFERAVAGLSQRVTGVTTLLGERGDAKLVRSNLIQAFESEFDVELHDGELSLSEHARYQRAFVETDTPDWVNLLHEPASAISVHAAAQPVARGTLTANVLYEHAARRIKQLWFTSDMPVAPLRGMLDLEAALSDTTVDRLERNVLAFFAAHGALRGVTAEHLIAVVRRALNLPLIALKI
ncbi:MAG: hypothetical protein ABIS45_04240 [Burkholderiales bacterium]